MNRKETSLQEVGTLPPKKKIAEVLLKEYGQTYTEELGIDLRKGTPSPLFRWLCASILFSARIPGKLALRAARALADEGGWVTPEKMAAASWEERTRVLNRSGYARYDERTSTMLGKTSRFLLEEYKGDLRRLRERAERDPKKERKLLKEFQGMGDVGVDIFFREVQVTWTELSPFADKRALKNAQRLELGDDAESLLRLVSESDFPRLIAALARVDLKKDLETILQEAE